MLQNANVTAFIFSELLSRNQQGRGNKSTPSTLIRVKDDLILYKCLCCNRYYQEKCGKNLKGRFDNTYKFSNDDIKKFIFMLWIDVYSHEYMGDYE